MQTLKSKYWLAAFVALLTASLLFTACDKQPIRPTEPDPVQPGSYMSIREFRAFYTGSDVTIPVGTKKIRGAVVSNSANEAAGNVRIQDESGAGIYIYTALGSPAYTTGTVLEVDAAGAGVLTLFNGDLELKNVPLAKVVTLSGGLTATPRVATVQTIKDSAQKWSSTLATINNVTITAGTTNGTGANYNITDATGTIVSFVRTTAGFAVPTGGATSITGYVSIFQSNGSTTPTIQLTLRTAADVVGGGQGGGTGGSGGTGTGTGITLGTSPYTIDFNNLAAGLPTGVTVDTAATPSFLGKPSSSITAAATAIWNRTAGGFKNFASATGLNMGSDSAAQASAANRSLGIRQTGSIGDPGAAFIFQLNNTTGKNNLKMDFQLQSLDTSSIVTRTTTWTVDYGIGDNPTTFTSATATGTLTTGNKVFSNNAINVVFPAALNNQSQKVWIRIVSLTPSTGSNNRPSTAIDDVKFTWN